MQRGLLVGSAAREFALAGNARITVVSKATGARYTYRIAANEDEAKFVSHFVSVLAGPDNERDYVYVGTVKDGSFRHGLRSTFGADAPCVKALSWAWTRLGGHPLLEVWHEGRCGACGRVLTVPGSVERGIGPDCALRIGHPSLVRSAPPPFERVPQGGSGRRRVA